MADPGALAATIAALNAQRGALGDAAIDAAIDALRRHAPTAAEATPAGPSAQRLRQVSVLFVDVAESTKLLSQVGAEDGDELLGQALQRFAEVVQRHGGQVLRFTGDGLKATFGSLGVRENEAAHAVEAGLEILDAAARHARDVQQQLRVEGFGVRVGIHTGAVLMGSGAEAERGAIGHAVHLAARMEQSAPVGRLRISRDTWLQVRGLFRVEAQPPLQVKGHAEPLVTYLVLGAEADPERAVQRGLDGLALPMIGRDTELQRLLGAYDRARSEGRLHAVTVIADAGVGKTRLRRELLARLPATNGVGVLQARAHPDSGLQPYGLLRQLLARWLSIADDLDAGSARTRLVGGLAPWLQPAGPERAERLGQLIGLDFGASPAVQALAPSELREHGFATLVDALHAVARESPLVVVIDDLHWADDASLDFVQQLASAAPVPLLLVMLARPSLFERRPQPLADDTVGHATLHLQPLDAEQGPALADALLQHLADPPEALRGLLVERAEGNPFYMEELVRMLMDDGVIDAGRRPWTLRLGWQAAARVPATLVGVLQARLQALPADELAALQQASIVGTLFWESALAAIDPAAPSALPALHARALVVPHDNSAFADTREHAFHHQILHDVAYDTVLKAARREGHARAARWLAERVAGRAGEFLGITAAHFERAGESAEALEYYDRARADAQTRFAHAAALACCDGALRQPALDAAQWRYQLLLDRQLALENLGRLDDALVARQAMAAFAEACDSDAMRADVATAEMLDADREGRAAEAEVLARKAVALAEPTDACGPAALAHGELAWLALMRSEFERAERHIALGMPWARAAAARPWREGGSVGYAQQLRIIGIEILLHQDRWFETRDAIVEALATLPPARRRERLSLVLQRMNSELAVGEIDDARRSADEATALADAIDVPRLRADAAEAVASVAHAAGDLETQERAARRAAELAQGAAHSATQAMASLHLGIVDLARGDGERAHTGFADARRQFEAQGMPARALDAGSWLAEAGRRAGRHDAALDAARALLAAGRGDARDLAVGPWPLLTAPALLRCLAILAGAGHEQAQAVRDELQRRLAQQLAHAPDAAARERLRRGVPHWRETAALPGVGLAA